MSYAESNLIHLPGNANEKGHAEKIRHGNKRLEEPGRGHLGNPECGKHDPCPAEKMHWYVIPEIGPIIEFGRANPVKERDGGENDDEWREVSVPDHGSKYIMRAKALRISAKGFSMRSSEILP